MMLTDNQIQELIRNNNISIDPYDDRNLHAGKYDVFLGQFLLIPKNIETVLDSTNPAVLPEYDKYDLEAGSFILRPQQFVLGQTNEQIGLDTTVGMFLDGSTTLARIGLTIHQTALYIPPGQDPHIITLELYNAGPWQIKLSYRQKIGKLVVFRYSEHNQTSAKGFNQYNGQQETTGAIFLEKST